MTVHRSRWGYHPCDYPTFLLLKELHGLYTRALRQHAAWLRWQRKEPQNRVVRQWFRDDRGNRTGARVLGPRPEPTLCPLFCTRQQVVRHLTRDGHVVREGTVAERVVLDDHGIPEAYQAARMPAASPEEVRPLPLTPEEIRRLAAQAAAVVPSPDHDRG